MNLKLRLLAALDGLLHRVCACYDRALGVTEDEMHRTAPPMVAGWTCQHMTITSAPGILTGPPVLSSCKCQMQPVYADSRR